MFAKGCYEITLLPLCAAFRDLFINGSLKLSKAAVL